MQSGKGDGKEEKISPGIGEMRELLLEWLTLHEPKLKRIPVAVQQLSPTLPAPARGRTSLVPPRALHFGLDQTRGGEARGLGFFTSPGEEIYSRKRQAGPLFTVEPAGNFERFLLGLLLFIGLRFPTSELIKFAVSLIGISYQIL